MLASEIINPVLKSVHEDVDNPVRWSIADLCEYLTDAMYQIVLLRPDANAKVEAVELVAGSTKQTLPDGGTQLLGVVRNMGADGQTPGQAIGLVLRPSLDAANLAWHTAIGEEVIDHYAFNEKTPQVFWVTPVPAEGVFIEIEYAKTPTAVIDKDSVIDLNPIWKGPLTNYVKYRCYAINAASQADNLKANEFLSRFYMDLGEEAKARLVFNPNADEGSAS